MASLEQHSCGRPPSTTHTILRESLAETDTAEDTESIVTIRAPVTDIQNGGNSDPRPTFDFTFDQDLNTSRPYTRAMKRHTICSTTSSEIHTMGPSFLSGLSLAEISHIPVINLPFCPQDLWNGNHYFATEIARDGFVLSKPYKYSSSLAVQPTPTLRSRLKTRNPIHLGQSRGKLNIIQEDKVVPVAVRTISLLGMFPLQPLEQSCYNSPVANHGSLLGESLSGKTTIFNHLQILYGNGITRLERLVAFEVIIRNLMDIFLRAWRVSLRSVEYGKKLQETDRKVRNTVRSFIAMLLLTLPKCPAFLDIG